MSLAQVSVREIVAKAADDEWGVPEFQRGFVWKPSQVRDLADSLSAQFPAGSLLLWEAKGHVEPRTTGGKPGTLWLIDGQQRTTALCLLFGVKPSWREQAAWQHDIARRFDIRLDLAETHGSPFKLLNSGRIKAASARYVPLRQVLRASPEEVQQMAQNARDSGLCGTQSFAMIFARLNDVQKISDRVLPVVTVNHGLEQVVEIFSRINAGGTHVKAGDIYLGLLAKKLPAGWVREEFLKYLDDLEQDGFDLDPALLLRGVAALGSRRAKFKEVPADFWTEAKILPAWKELKTGFADLKSELADHGIFGTQLLPSRTALLALLIVRRRYLTAPFAPIFGWFLDASRTGRFSGTTETNLQETMQAIDAHDNIMDGLLALRQQMGTVAPYEADDFLRDYGDWRFGRLLVYLMAYNRKALDWDSSNPHRRIGFDNNGITSGYAPQWHHVFPRGYLNKAQLPESALELRESFANIAVVGPAVNLKIGAKAPADYMLSAKIDDSRLLAQCIDPSIRQIDAAQFPSWVKQRAEALADAANEYRNSLD